MRRYVAAAFLAVAVAGAAPARSSPTGAVPDFAYAVTARGFFHKSAVCIARGGDAAHGERLAGLGAYGGMDWSPDGGRLAVALRRGPAWAIGVLSATRRMPRPLTSARATEDDSSPEWSPDGTTIVFDRYVFYGPRTDYRRHGLWLVDVATRRERHLSTRFATAKDWSPDGDRLAAVFSDELSAFAKAGRRVWTIRRSTAESELTHVAWAPAGDLIAAQHGREVLLVRAGDGSVVATLTRPENPNSRLEAGLSWSADGRLLAVGGGIVFDRGGAIVARYAPPSTEDAIAANPTWTPDGTAILFERARAVVVGSRYDLRPVRGNADLYVAPSEGGAATRLTATTEIDERDIVFRPRPQAHRRQAAQPCIHVGTAGRDRIRGGAGEDLISAGPGDDAIFGLGGNDLLVGDDGNDVVAGGAGRDVLLGDRGNDRLHARDGQIDRVVGGPGRDRAWIDRRRDVRVGVERLAR